MKNSIPFIFILSMMFAQQECDNGRYNTEIFSNVNVTSEIFYGSNTNSDFFGDVEEDLYLDIYEPDGDNLDNRPLVIFLFGGAYIGGSRTSPDIVELCTRYAKMGYVAAAIDYRLTLDLVWLSTEANAYKAAAKGVHDLKGAIRYFRMNDELYDDYNIDSDRIYAGGVSAGAISAVNAAYLNLESELPSFLEDYFEDNGGTEGNSGNPGYASEFHGVINLCGAVGHTDWIIENDIPIVSLHGTEDEVVPYGDGMITLLGLNMNVMGSYSIHNRMVALGNNSAFLSWDGVDHTPFVSSAAFMDETVEFSANFIHDLACATSFMLGDLNIDSTLNILDVILLVNVILDPSQASDQIMEAGDLNGDATLNVLDIISLVNMILSSP
ncbi:MAG: carboxylesterase family protein [Candidatus Marinimicrobia bacterium]|nr:carboxylesterase family protein [Candidatus Neomarinimicrobiota bacterium]|tara:strand:- start:2572 stop:3717 length:1146 start_codon:yes stop_codon:yes gene_type:complete